MHPCDAFLRFYNRKLSCTHHDCTQELFKMTKKFIRIQETPILTRCQKVSKTSENGPESVVFVGMFKSFIYRRRHAHILDNLGRKWGNPCKLRAYLDDLQESVDFSKTDKIYDICCGEVSTNQVGTLEIFGQL